MRRLLLCALLVTVPLFAAPPEFGAHEYIEYQAGTLPLVIATPHGGLLKPEALPDRTYGVVDQDQNTQEMARALCEALAKKTGGSPHLVVCLLHRCKLDCNREIEEAAQGGDNAKKAWSEYQGFITRAKTRVKEQFGTGLFIDFHGQRHKEGRVELGYMIAPDKLRKADEPLNNDKLTIRASSIRELEQRSPATFVELLRGPNSLGALLEAQGYRSVPSPSIHGPAEGEQYFRGGYNTDTHGSRQGGTFNAVQIECPFDGVRDTAANRAKFIDVLSDVLPAWFQAHYGAPLAPLRPVSKSPSP